MPRSAAQRLGSVQAGRRGGDRVSSLGSGSALSVADSARGASTHGLHPMEINW